MGGGSPAGSTTEIQFNNAGAFAASSKLIFEEAIANTNRLTLKGDPSDSAWLVIANAIGDAGSASEVHLASDNSGTVLFQSADHATTYSSLYAGPATGAAGLTISSILNVSADVHLKNDAGITLYAESSDGSISLGSLYFNNNGAVNLNAAAGQSIHLNPDDGNVQWTFGANGVLALPGGLNQKLTSVSTTYTAASESVIEADATSGAFTITLPPASTAGSGRTYTIKKIDAINTITIQGDGAETIDGSNTQSLVSQWAALTVICNGTSWLIV
jgi:hypothetical protein